MQRPALVERVPGVPPGVWTDHDDEMLLEMATRYGTGHWEKVAAKMRDGFSADACRDRWAIVRANIIKVRLFVAAPPPGRRYSFLAHRDRGPRRRTTC